MECPVRALIIGELPISGLPAGWNSEPPTSASPYHLNVDLLRDIFYALQRQAAPGVDGVRWQEYESGLEDRLTDLAGRVHRGTYWAQPSRRIYISKADGRQRPLGIAALEDKVVQQAVVTILNQLYGSTSKASPTGSVPAAAPIRRSMRLPWDWNGRR